MATTDGTDLLGQAFALLAERGWQRFSFAELARRSGSGLAEVYAELPGRPALLRALGRRLDREMLQIDLAELDDMTPRERMFELIMRRLDAMAPYKEGLRALARASRRQPDVLLAACCNLDRLGRRLLDAAAGEQPPVLAGLARRAAQLVYLCTLRVWLDDDSPDMARTLAELDRRLQQAEAAARWLGGSGRGRAAPA